MHSKMQRIIAMILVCCLMLSLDSFVAMAEEEGKVSFDTVGKKENEFSEEWTNFIGDTELTWDDESASGEEVSLWNETATVDAESLARQRVMCQTYFIIRYT